MPLPADWLAYVANVERELKAAPTPPKRRQPRVTRMLSKRMQRVAGQTRNSVRAIYTPESERAATPTKPESWRGTRNLGGNAQPKHEFFSAKATQTRLPKNWS
jgi:hypothetical protein